MKKIIALAAVFAFAASGCRLVPAKAERDWQKIDQVLKDNPERGKYFAIWDNKIQIKTDSWEELMEQVRKKCPKDQTPFYYYRPSGQP